MASSPKYPSDIDEGIEGTKLKYTSRKQQQQAMDAKTRFKAYIRASLFVSEKPNRNPFFIVAMHPSYVCTQTVLFGNHDRRTVLYYYSFHESMVKAR